ncbi:hypothetical protein FKX85_15925 [Echinicola soli]|uniref:6-bladed beta-propeller n=1 Tax=Echinicola soli TaxID=2591634 RepID=A0A514CKY1_9BACT|nr:hypothetical protein [Echinicola soli]QDH80448.1 hypothetical protein FKX85_15925 [Echinicola soli]
MSINKLIFIGISILLFTNCNKKDNTKDGEIIETIKVGQALSQELKFSDFFKTITPVQLDPNHIVGQIDKVVVKDSLIFISDFYLMKSLKVYDFNGKLLSERDDIGEGPYGMSEITDFSYYKNKLYVLDGTSRRILIFDKDLNDLGTFNIKELANNLWVDDSGIYLYYQNRLDGIDFNFSLYDHEGKWIEDFFPKTDKLNETILSGEEFFFPVEDEVIHYHPYIDSLYIIEDRTINKIRIDFNNNFLPYEYFDISHPVERLKKVNSFNGYYKISNGIKLTKNKFLFTILYNRRQKILLVDLEKNVGIVYKSLKNDLANLPSTGINFKGNSNDFAWYYQTYDQLNRFYQLNKRLIDKEDWIFNGATDKETPVIFICKY